MAARRNRLRTTGDDTLGNDRPTCTAVNIAVTVQVQAGSPPYEQIRRQIADSIRRGQLGDGERLPTVRALAADLGVAVNTVARAYQELEAEGLVAGRGRSGTVVTHTADGSAELRVHELARELVAQARRAGLADDAVLAIVRTRLHPGPPGAPAG